MDEKTRILVCIGAATAANCIPCFEYYFGKTEAAGLSLEEVDEAVDLGSQVKKGAHMALRNSIANVMGRKKSYAMPCDSQSKNSCCG